MALILLDRRVFVMKSKVLFAFIALVLAVLCVVAPVSAAEIYTPRISDNANALTEQDETALLSAMSAAGEKAQIHFYVYTRDGRLGEGEHEDEIFRAFPNAYYEDSLVLVVEKNNSAGDGYYYWLYTYGDAYSLLSDSECDELLDDSHVYSNLKRGSILAGARRFISLSADMIAENRTAKARTAKTLLIVLPIVFGVAAGGVAVGVVVYKYKRKLKSAVYPLSNYATLNLTHAEDNYITSSVTRTRVASSSSGGRSGGGGGGSRGGR